MPEDADEFRNEGGHNDLLGKRAANHGAFYRKVPSYIGQHFRESRQLSRRVGTLAARILSGLFQSAITS
jgi:hypothetical protein